MSRDEAVIEILARELKAARSHHGISLPTAAAQIGISISALRRIESGTSRNCAGETLFKILHWAYTKLGYVEFAGFSRRRREPMLSFRRVRGHPCFSPDADHAEVSHCVWSNSSDGAVTLADLDK